MNRRQLAHVLRAAADVAGDGRILVLGSQAILATHAATDLPPSVTLSVEVDIAFFEDARNALSDAVDGAIGEDSMFHEAHGYYGQGVSITTAVLPDGWQERLVTFAPADAEPGTGRLSGPRRSRRGEAGRRQIKGPGICVSASCWWSGRCLCVA